MRHSNRSTNYLVKNRYSYCFRLKVPLDLQNFIGKKELRYSLKTGFIGIANNKAWILAGKIQLLFNALRKGDTRLMNLTEDQIKELVEKYVKAELRNLDERVLNPFEEGFAPGYVDKSTMESYMDDLDDIRQDWLSKPNPTSAVQKEIHKKEAKKLRAALVNN